MDTKKLIPVDGCCVSRPSSGTVGIVRARRDINGRIELRVKWHKSSSDLEWVNLEEVRSGFQLKMEVQDIPYSRTRSPLGEGVVVETRTIGNRGQVLVEFPELGQRHWLPYENLRQVKGPRHRFVLGQLGNADAAGAVPAEEPCVRAGAME